MKANRFMGRFMLIAAAVLLLALAGGARASDVQVQAALDMVPPETAITIVVPDMAGLSTKIAALGRALNINSPEMADLLGTLKKEMMQGAGTAQGFKDDGALVFALTDIQNLPPFGMGGGPPPILVFLPVKDYKAFVGNFKGNADDEVATLALPGGENGFARKVGEFALVSPVEDAVKNYKAPKAGEQWTKALGKLGTRNSGKSDAMIILDVEVMAPTIQPMVTMALGNMQQQFNGGALPPGVSPAQAKMITTIMGFYADAAQAILRDAKFLVISGDLNDKGVGLTYTGQFKPESYLAKIFSTGGGASGQMTRLPEAAYLFAAAWSTKGIDVATLSKDILAKIPADADDMYSVMLRTLLPQMSKVQGGGAIYFAPQNKQPGAGALISGVGIVQTSDAPGYLKASAQMFQDMSKAATAAGGNDANAPMMTAKYTENIMQVDGLQVSQYDMTMNLPGGDAAGGQNGPGQILNMLGVTSQSGLVVASGDYVISTITADPKILKQALASVKGTGAMSASNVMNQVRKDGLPENATMEIYVHAGSIASLVNMIMGVMGMPAIQIPADLPPVGAAIESEEGGLAGRVYAPVSVIKFVKDAIEQSGMGGGGGARPAPRRGAAPPF